MITDKSNCEEEIHVEEERVSKKSECGNYNGFDECDDSVCDCDEEQSKEKEKTGSEVHDEKHLEKKIRKRRCDGKEHGDMLKDIIKRA
jgi:hypothetical protein